MELASFVPSCFFVTNHTDDRGEAVRAYCRIARWAEGRPVTVVAGMLERTSRLPATPLMQSRIPSLACGGRLSLLHRGVLASQLRALARAAVLRRCRFGADGESRMSGSGAANAERHDESLTKEVWTAPNGVGMMVEVPAPPHLRLVRGRFLLDRV